jgi:hypothetical protein
VTCGGERCDVSCDDSACGAGVCCSALVCNVGSETCG